MVTLKFDPTDWTECMKIGPRPASHEKNSTSVYYILYLYIYNNLTTPKQKQIDKKAERSIGYILAGTQKKKLRYTREAACLRLNVYFMHWTPYRRLVYCLKIEVK